MSDLIDRQAAIDALERGAWGKEWDKTLARAMIESMPSAQPEHEYTMEEFMYGQDMGNPEDGSL